MEIVLGLCIFALLGKREVGLDFVSVWDILVLLVFSVFHSQGFFAILSLSKVNNVAVLGGGDMVHTNLVLLTYQHLIYLTKIFFSFLFLFFVFP